MPDATTTTGATTGTTTTTTTAAPWYQGLAGVDDVMVGHFKNRGWDTKPAAEVAVEATKAWKEAERFVGAPAAELLRVPKDAGDEAGWKRVWGRLGVPADAKEYDFSGVKRADGTALDENFANAIRAAAYRLNVPKDAAASLAAEFTKYLDSTDTTEKAEKTAKLAEQKAALKKNWGANEAAHMFVAQRAAAALGVKPEDVTALEGVIGYDRVMEMFRTIGSKIGEDKFIQGQQGNQQGVMTRDQATARLEELKADKEYVKSYLAGDAVKKREMAALHLIIAGQAA